MRAAPPDDTELARRATGGDGQAFGLLFDRWLDRAFDVAWHVVHDRETAADVAQEAFAVAWQRIGTLRQPESFGGWLLRITRNTALTRLQRERRSRPTGSEEALVTLDPRQAEEPSASLERREHGDLVWAASAALGQEDASLLSLHLRHDLGAPELAEELGVEPNAAHQRLFRLRKRLAEAVGAWVLWRGGAPSCPELNAALERAEASRFDRGTAKAILTHSRGCEACDYNRQLRLSPEALFAAMPLVPAGPTLQAKVTAALQSQDIPVTSTGPSGSGDAPGSEQTTGPDELSTPEHPLGPRSRETPGATERVADAQASGTTSDPDGTAAPDGADAASGPGEVVQPGTPAEQAAQPHDGQEQGHAGEPSGPDDTQASGQAESLGADGPGQPHAAPAPGPTGEVGEPHAARASDEDAAPDEQSGDAQSETSGSYGTDGRQPARGSDAADGPQLPVVAPDTVDVAPASRSRRGRRTAALVGGAVVVVGLVAIALLLTRPADRTDDVGARPPVAAATDPTEPRRETTTTSADDEPTTTTATSTPSDQETAPSDPSGPGGRADTATETDPVDTTAPTVTEPPEPDDDGRSETTDAPEIGGFTVRSADRSCGGAGEIEVVFAWQTSHATATTLGMLGGQPEVVPPTGNTTRCAPPGSTWTLTATGPGGTVERQATVPAAPAFTQP